MPTVDAHAAQAGPDVRSPAPTPPPARPRPATDPPPAADPESAAWRRPPASPEERHSDALAAGLLCAVGILSLLLTRTYGLYGQDAAPLALAAPLVLAAIAPLAVRRRWPSAVAVAVAAVFIAAGELSVPETLILNVALFCALYTVGAWEPDRRRATWTRGGIVAVMAVWLFLSFFRATTQDVDLGLPGSALGALTPTAAFWLQQVLINVLYFAGAWWFGNTAWSSARQRALIEHRTEQLAQAQARAARQAVTIERLRIARELHDAVAHHVSLMGVQAAAARALLPRDAPAQSTQASRDQLTALEDSARSAVAELYQLLGTLRDEEAEHDAAGDSASASLSLADLAPLVADAEAAGLHVSVTEVGEPRPLPPLVGLNLFRIAQESLTNVAKHAGPGTRTRIAVRYLPGAVELEVSDDGRGRPGPPPAGGGLGQRGMRERVASMRGELLAEPRSGSGYVVRARVPLEGSRP
ncbi:sensor histidine kinase [Miniimonas arenae]|uniref:sensor histidine kinase n=1 Tax=Miniimonas arenae TaxID=676201 RepID=UPI001FE8A5AE|nr:histidine kinase [Miniimonas arenae]